MSTWLRACPWWLAAAVLAGPAWAVPGRPALSAPLAADFALAIDGAQPTNEPPTQGRLVLQPGGRACLRVRQPLVQEMALDPKGAIIFYPDKGLRIKATAGEGSPAGTLDAITVALADPTSALPQGSALTQQSRTGDVVVSRWRVAQQGGGTAGLLEVHETKAGVQQIDQRDKDGQLQRRYRFGERVAGVRLPGEITAEYFGSAGKMARRERWRLRASAVTPADLRPCAVPAPGQQVKDL